RLASETTVSAVASRCLIQAGSGVDAALFAEAVAQLGGTSRCWLGVPHMAPMRSAAKALRKVRRAGDRPGCLPPVRTGAHSVPQASDDESAAVTVGAAEPDQQHPPPRQAGEGLEIRESHTVCQLIRTHAERTPDAIALLAPERAHLSYGKLLRQVEQVV